MADTLLLPCVCSKEPTPHVYVSPEEDIVTGQLSQQTIQSGCKSGPSDYRTHRCIQCGVVRTSNFSSEQGVV
jgi:hypothetical protein